ncbi:hypothetical protein PVL29_022856 [Vitis rotundifolia]|uniref:Uncharacterized protein n=1 Tax=Vitis rotundifolia TaxID=103349 RepID=A0AA38YWP6_VITRO|nr:hypothetical protein PVL29_022856 [Vitis rotundifolia]
MHKLVSLDAKKRSLLGESSMHISMLWLGFSSGMMQKDSNCCEEFSFATVKLMKWDEDIFGLEYGLVPFNIVEIPDFDMEPLVLASPETVVVVDYTAILGIIGPE